MIRYLKLSLFVLLCVSAASFTFDSHFITFNTSSKQNVIATSIATNYYGQIQLFSPILIQKGNSLTKIIANQQKKKLTFQPPIIDDNELLYNDHHDGQYWFAFKKQNNQKLRDVTATFGFARVNVGQIRQQLLLPFFNLPLSFVDVTSLYQCHDVLLSYQKTQSLIDFAVFSKEQLWHVYPNALWGFRNKDQEINFSRQTFPLGTQIKVELKDKRFCILNDNLAPNTVNIVEKQIYTLDELLSEYSADLQIRSAASQEEL